MTESTPSTRVMLIRHGETDWNAEGRWQGHAPVPLNTTGHAQAEALAKYLAKYLAKNDTRFDVLYSSDCKRAVQTAEKITTALDLPLNLDERLREVDLGQWQGMTRAEAEAWDGERFAAFSADWYTVSIPDGESRNELKTRMRAAFEDITERHPGQHIAIVSHGGSLAMLIESLFGKFDRPDFTNTSITELEQNEVAQLWTLESLAIAPHLEKAPRGETW